MTADELEEYAPLYRAVRRYVRMKPARFHTPGHKGSSASPLAGLMGGALAFDVTELPQTDSLFEADGPIREAERLAARYAGTGATLLSAGGATLCIQGMLAVAAASGRRRVILARNSHRSAVNAAALLGLDPVWVWPRGFEGSGLPGCICAEDVAATLRNTPDAAAVFITSPDYYGVMSDIASIARECHGHGVPLLVDNAHGAHLQCLDGGVRHPLRLGADMACDSAHKTLPVLTGGAWLQLADARRMEAARAAMALFGSTSPSYLILLSLDIARTWMERGGAAAFDALRERVAAVRERCASLGFRSPAGAVFDPVRLTLDTASVGRTGREAAEMMRRAGVEPEWSDGAHVVLLPAPFQPPEDWDRLETVLRRIPAGAPLPLPECPSVRPERILSPHEALSAPGETVEISRAAGRTAAQSGCPCPPGVPVVMPGERITGNLAKLLKSSGIRYIKVVK